MRLKSFPSHTSAVMIPVIVPDPAIERKSKCMLCDNVFVLDSVSPVCKEILVCRRCFDVNVNMLGTFEAEHVKPYIEPNHVIDNIYIGPDNSALDRDKMHALGITHVLVAGNHLKCRYPDDFTYFKLDIDDSLEQDILSVIDQSIQFIHDVNTKNKGKVLVHCASGISRSASIVIAYLMRFTVMTSFETAYKFLFEKRSKVHPNTNFVRQLKQWGELLKIDENQHSDPE